ncbi:hypothetical protein IAI51_23050 [Pseudomonas sp. N40(2020)]|uniref:hypothetical protein n=1 Tax=Pseudomonas sp. N40(2020) TaxID=2767798 RepID=UPI001656E348|nr:hypothetical protein [Pseudomonas sp. N40(2020)]MBC8999405.1 hypothetical protein [Pseudomonas sp. N40(2020)]
MADTALILADIQNDFFSGGKWELNSNICPGFPVDVFRGYTDVKTIRSIGLLLLANTERAKGGDFS